MDTEVPLLSLRQINTFYAAQQVHFDLTLSVRPGEVICLLGGNASGKSTVMKVILGLVTPRSGEVCWKGQNWQTTDTPDRIRAGLASVPESRRLFGAMTVAENLALGAYVRRDPIEIRADQEAVLELFPLLKDRLRQMAGTLSGGEQQLVALARALMSRPQLVLMDEPTMGLSPLWVDRVWSLVNTVNRRGTAFLVVEQNAHLALALAHRGYVLQNGHLVLEGTAEALRGDPRVRDAYLGAHQMTGGDQIE